MRLKKILIYILLVSGIGLGLIISCSDSPENTANSGLEGTWLSGCTSSYYGSSDRNYGYTFSDNTVEVISNTYSSTNLSCTGTKSTFSNSYTFTTGSDITAYNNSSYQSITATELDVDYGYTTLYTIYWIDTSTVPNILYLGTPASMYTDSGATAATRHTRLSSSPYYLQ
jgi:hypothetical protein